MTTIMNVTLQVPRPEAVRPIIDALGIASLVELSRAEPPSDGFRGFTISLVASQPADVDALMSAGVDAGAAVSNPAKKSLWGYGGAIRTPDGTAVTVAAASKKSTGPALAAFDRMILQLGVDDVAASKRFYVDRGLVVAKSYGRKYVEFDSGAVTLTLNDRRTVAKVAGSAPEGSGSHRLVFGADAGAFTDPDGYEWE